jgi:hypothetical protein
LDCNRKLMILSLKKKSLKTTFQELNGLFIRFIFHFRFVLVTRSFHNFMHDVIT